MLLLGTLGLVSNGQVANVNIFYTVDVLDPTQGISQVSLDFNGAIVNGGLTKVTETVFNNGTIVGQLLVTNPPVDLQDPAFEVNSDIPLPGSSFTTLRIQKDIQVSCLFPTTGQTCSASISIIGQDFEQTDRVPEPASMLLLGAGMLGVGFLARRRRSGR